MFGKTSAHVLRVGESGGGYQSSGFLPGFGFGCGFGHGSILGILRTIVSHTST
jgi:hypothetical protein